jgi:hypothetical protein
MEERGVGEDAVEAAGGELQREEILLPDLAATVLACHGSERRGALEADGLVAEGPKRRQITTGAAAEIEKF